MKVCYVSFLKVLWVGLWSVIVAFPQFSGLILTCFFVLSVMLYQGILLTEHFQRLGCVMNNQNEIGCDAYATKSLS